jgi:hypothetical protein
MMQALRLRSAARKYARRLGPQLAKSYGPAEYYTREQIRAASLKCRLPRRYLSIGYAAFMPEEAFREIVNNNLQDYQELRVLFLRYVDFGLRSATSNASENPYIMQGGGSP